MYAESHTATAHTDPHLAGNICAAIHDAGVMMVNPGYVGLLQLISDGVVDLAVYVNYTNMAISIKKPYFKYILKMISTALKDGDLTRTVVAVNGATVSLNKTEVRILGEEKAAQNASAQTFMVDEMTGKML